MSTRVLDKGKLSEQMTSGYPTRSNVQLGKKNIYTHTKSKQSLMPLCLHLHSVRQCALSSGAIARWSYSTTELHALIHGDNSRKSSIDLCLITLEGRNISGLSLCLKSST